VISDGYWARAFGRAPDVIGKTLTIRGRPAAIVGVTASGFYGFEPGSHVDITLPMSVRALDDAQFLDDHGGWTGMRIVGRLKVGESQALAAVDALFQQYMVEPENRWARDAGSTHFKSAALVPAARGDQDLRLRYATALTVLMAMVGVVLLIACANVANLQLARAAARAKEIAVRASIGASRRRLVRQLLTESFLLACCGGALGLLVAVWSTSVILALFETGQNPVLIDVTLNIRVLAFTTAVSVLTGVAFGLVPAFRATRVDLTPALKESGDIATRGRRSTVATTLVVTQIALCVLVISTAGLLVRSLRNLRSLDTGFARHKVLLFNLDLAGPAFSPDRRHTFYADLLDRLRGLPGVESVSSSTRSPIDDTRVLRRIDVPGFQSTERHGVSTNVVTPGYFQTFGMRLIRGRGFGAEDRPATPRVAVVGESMARFYFGQSDPIGRTFVLGGEKDATTIVGVVQDVRHERMREAPPKMVYTLLAQSASVVTFGGGSAVPQRVSVAIRSQGTPGGLAASVGTEVRGLSRDAMVSYVRTMEQQVDAALVRERVLASLSTGFGLLALALACVGLYGVMSYSVARRGREIGIRIALGASRMTVLQQILRETLAVALAGVALGLGAALAATQIVSRFLFELTPRDPLTLAMAASLLLLTTAVAGFLPARRAAHVDPMQALRAD
jgi:predicted permease